MKLTLRSLLLVSLLSIFGGAASAQVTTGTPPFGSFGGGPVDTINLANLNARISVPVLNKAGRGLPFSSNLVYDSSTWYPVGSSGSQTWQPVMNFGWSTQAASFMGYLTYAVYSTSYYYCIPPPGYGAGCYWGTLYSWGNVVYTDASGSPHSFPGAGGVGTFGYSGAACNSSSTVASDGSGNTLLCSSTAMQILLPSGKVISPPINTMSAAVTTVDANGNEITANNTGVFTDTLGQTVLTIAGFGTPASPTTFTYTAPSGANATYTMKYASYTVQTNFGCSGIAEYGPTAQNLVTEIDLPDQGINSSDKYTFTYEATPGHAGNVTARLASVTLPTGGTIYYTYTGGSNGIVCADGSAAGLTRQTPDGTWTYARTMGTAPASTTTITDPQSNQTVINFQGIYPTERQVYQGSTSGTLLKTTYTCYNSAASPCNSTAITLPITQRTHILQWPGGLESETNTSYNGYGLFLEKDEYGYGSGAPGPIVRKTLTALCRLGKLDRQ